MSKVTALRSYTREELINILGVSERTFWRRLKRGEIVKTGGTGGPRYRVRTADAEEPSEEPTSGETLLQILQQLSDAQREIGRLEERLAEAQRDNARAWNVIGDLTTEAIHLEAQLSRYE